MPQIKVGDTILELPEGAPPEAIQKAIAHYRSTPEFDATIDKKSGGGAMARALVGGAPIQDKLANVRRFYPDAVEYGDGNFVFTDPKSGRPTLFNPPGMDFGDLAGVTREASQFVGGALGASGGAVFGAGPLGAVVGAGAGTAAGGAAFDATMNLLGGRIDTRSPVQATIDTAIDFGAGAIGQKLGDMIGKGIQKIAGMGTQTARQVWQNFMDLGIEPPAGTMSRAAGSVQTMLANTPSGANVMQEQAQKVVGQITRAADRVVSRIGVPQTDQGAGGVIRQAAQEAIDYIDDPVYGQTAQLYDEAFKLVGGDTPVSVPNVSSLLQTMRGELGRAPESLGDALAPAIRQLTAIQDDAARGGIPFDALRQVRTMVGREMNDRATPSLKQTNLKRIYAALSEDLSAAAQRAGGEAADRLSAADEATRLWKTGSEKLLKKVADFDADEKAWKFVWNSARDGGTALTKLRSHFTNEEWDTVAATFLNRLGRSTPGKQNAAGDAFSVNTFLTQWNRLAPEAKETLFGGGRYADMAGDLTKLTQAMESLKGMEALANTSNTGHVLIGYATLSTIMGALGTMASGDITGGVAAAGASVAGPYAAAKLITSPSFVKWLATPVTRVQSLSSHVARLAAIAEGEPAIREEIYQYMQALRSMPAEQAQAEESDDAPARQPVPMLLPSIGPPIAAAHGAVNE